MARKSFMQGAVILGGAGIFIKLLGAFFRIPLTNLIGPRGMAYYQSAYPIYVFFLTIATAGIPLAISKMVSERIATEKHYEASRVFRISFVLLLLIGIGSSSICFFGAEWIMGKIEMERAVHSMKAIAPALFFVPIMAAFRGYFQGMQNMKVTAISQSVEQLFRVASGLFLAYYLIDRGLEYAAAGAAFGATVGAVFGLVVVLIMYALHRNTLRGDIERTRGEKEEKESAILLRILVIAIPITIGAAIMPIMNTIDVGIVVWRLQETGWSKDEAEILYGQLTGMVGPLINFPQVLTQAVAMSLVPAISIAKEQNELGFMRENMALGLRSAIFVGLPCAFGLMFLAEPILLTIYPLQQEGALGAVPCLFIMGFGVIFLSTAQALTGMLQGIGKQLIPVRNLLIGAVVKVYLSYQLIGMAGIDVKGAAIGTVTAYIIASALNLMGVKRHAGVTFDLKLTYGKPLLAAAVMALAVRGSHWLLCPILGNGFATLISIVVGVAVYGRMIFAVKAITKEELAKLPKGSKIVKIINRFVK